MQCSYGMCPLKDECERYSKESSDSFKKICNDLIGYIWFIKKQMPLTVVTDEDTKETKQEETAKVEDPINDS